MRLTGHGAFQLGFFIAMLVAIVQLTLDRVDLFLLIGEGFASVVNEYGLSAVSRSGSLGLWNLAIQIQTSLLQLLCSPVRVGRLCRGTSDWCRGCGADWLPVSGCA